MPSKKDNEEINSNSKYDKNDNSDKKSTKELNQQYKKLLVKTILVL